MASLRSELRYETLLLSLLFRRSKTGPTLRPVLLELTLDSISIG